MTKGRNGVETDKTGNGDLEPYYRLIEMQKQMIELIQRNAHAERACAALREQLAREAEALARSRRSLPDRLRNSASGLLKRLLGRNGGKSDQAHGPLAINWSPSFEERNSLPTAQRHQLDSRNGGCVAS
jgi:hypothetical protein